MACIPSSPAKPPTLGAKLSLEEARDNSKAHVRKVHKQPTQLRARAQARWGARWERRTVRRTARRAPALGR